MTYREEIINNKKIIVADNVLSNDHVQDFYNYVSGLSYFKVEKANDHDELPKFSRDLKPNKFETKSPIGINARKLLDRFYKGEYVLFRVTINLILKGDAEFPHRDIPVPIDNITILYYANSLWDYRWGGETIFYSDTDSQFGILPHPGRYALFDSYLEHKAGVPTFFSKQPRYTLALKYTSRENILNQIKK